MPYLRNIVMGRKTKIYLVLAISLFVVFVVFAKFENNAGEENEKNINREKREVDSTADMKNYMSLDDWSTKFSNIRTFYPNWITGDEYVAFSAGAIIKKKISDESRTDTLLPTGVWAGLGTAWDYNASPDGQYIAVYSKRVEDYSPYTIRFDVNIYLAGQSTTVRSIENVQRFKWSPTGHKISYVQEFNVYLVTDVTGDVKQLTTDGKDNLIYNGIPDWMQGGITDDNSLLWWSPNSQYLIYARFDENEVIQFEFSRFVKKQYPETVKFPYPKPGTKIPTTTLHVCDTESANQTDVQLFLPSQGVQNWNEYYLNSLMWRSNNSFVPTWRSRYQNNSISDVCVATDATSCNGKISGLMRTSTSGWLGHYNPAGLIRGSNDNEVITIYSNNNFPRVAVVDVSSGNINYRTSGNFEVTSISFYDPSGDWVYYVSTELETIPDDGLPRIRHLWKVKGHGSDSTRTCITCSLNKVYKDRCNWVKPSFSTTGEYLVVNCGGTGNGIPISTSHKQNSKGNYDIVRIEEDNDRLNQTLNEYYYRELKYETLQLDGISGDWYYSLYLPPNFDQNKKYPLLLQVYSGPGWQNSVEDFEYVSDWARGYIASSELDVVVMTFDGRGTGYRGDEIMHLIYRKLGVLETIDQISAVKKVLDRHTYLDKDRVAVWGRSYGGYMTTRIIESDNDLVFKCGFSVAPVIDWKFYHALYTEKFMGSPYGDNEEGYKQSTALQNYDVIKKHKYYLVHGTSDENVHFQNAARMSRALVEHNVDFGGYFAGDEVHRFTRGENAYRHHYKYLTTKLKECFGIN